MVSLLFLLWWSNNCEGKVVYRLALIPKNKGNSFFDEVRDGCVGGAKELSQKREEYEVICEYLVPQSLKEDDIATQKQIDILEDIISSRSHDGVAISVNDDEKLTPYLNKVIESGIPLITFDSDASRSKRHFYVGTNNTAFGDQLAKVLLQLKPGGGKFGIVSSFPAANLQERVNGFKSRMNDTGWIEVETSPKDGEGNPDVCLQRMYELLSEHPDIGAIIPVGAWPMANSSGWKEFVEKNRRVSSVIGDTKQSQIDLISQGYGDGLVGQMPFDMGKVSACKYIS